MGPQKSRVGISGQKGSQSCVREELKKKKRSLDGATRKSLVTLRNTVSVELEGKVRHHGLDESIVER